MSIKDSNILIVFELVAVEDHNGTVKRVSKGWAFLRPFASDDVVDLSSGRESPSQRCVRVTLVVSVRETGHVLSAWQDAIICFSLIYYYLLISGCSFLKL